MPKPIFRDRVEEIRKKFIEAQKTKARVSRRAKKRFRQLVGTRSVRLVIRESAAGRKYMLMTYRKVTSREVKRYKVAPYSFRYKRTRPGYRKLLFAYDFKDRHIKSFYVKNIRAVERTDSNFKPLWPVEIML